MFTHTNEDKPTVTCAKLDKAILEFSPRNITIQFMEGKLNEDNEFVSSGVGSICIANTDKVSEYLSLTTEEEIEVFLKENILISEEEVLIINEE